MPESSPVLTLYMEPANPKQPAPWSGSVLRAVVWRLLLLNTVLVFGLPLAKLLGGLQISWLAATAPLWLPAGLAVPVGLWLRRANRQASE